MRGERGDARDEAILETLIVLYDTGQLRCAEGPLRISPIIDTDEIRLRGASASDYSVRFPHSRFRDLIHLNRGPVTEELVRVILCLIYHHPEQYSWATKESGRRPLERQPDAREEPRA